MSAAPPRQQSPAAVAEQAMNSIAELLVRERAAVAALDVDGLAAIAADKDALLGRLPALLAAAAPELGHDGARGLKQAAARMRMAAAANRALLCDAADSVAAALGLAPAAAAYDARARRVAAPSYGRGRNV